MEIMVRLHRRRDGDHKCVTRDDDDSKKQFNESNVRYAYPEYTHERSWDYT